MAVEIYRSFFEIYFGKLPSTSAEGEVVVSNPFRHDRNPSLSINLQKGLFHDFGDDGFGGDAVNLYSMMHHVPLATARQIIDEYLEGKMPECVPIPKETIRQWHHSLLDDIKLKTYVVKERGLSLKTITEHLIGWDGERYTIPIFNEWGLCINVRRYKPKHPTAKIISYAKGYGSVQLYPLTALKQDTVYLHEGEWDALAQISRGFNAITTTGGAAAWNGAWNGLFAEKKVYVCYDTDRAGQKGAKRIAETLAQYASEVYLVTLPLEGTANSKDISDFYLKEGHSPEDFEELLRSSDRVLPAEIELLPEESENETDKSKQPLKLTRIRQKIEEYVAPTGEAVETTLPEARNGKYRGKRIVFKAQVIGKNTTPYNIPKIVRFTCENPGEDKGCQSCPLNGLDGSMKYVIDTNGIMLNLIKTKTNQQLAYIRAMSGIGEKCKKVKTITISSVNVEELLLSPALTDGESSTKHEYLVQTAYFAGKSIETNRTYVVEGEMLPDPWQQSVTFFLDACEPVQDSIENFAMDKEMLERLKVFQPDEGQTEEDKLADIHSDLSANVTHIVGREDLLMASDLVYHSVMSFSFQNTPIEKSAVECLCIGDTRTGKSETMERILNHYQLGEMTVAENVSYAGLVGGLQQTGDKRWFLTWGKIPLNHGRLLVIDEASGLSEEDIAKMSGIRSRGIAEITKIQTERTNAKTRMMWLSNPRSGNSLSSYGFGVLAARELIGKNEDLARFDFALTAARDEVEMQDINRLTAKQHPHQYTSELCRDLVLWAWSRKPEQVTFTEEAVSSIIRETLRMSKKYHAKLPLVEGANQRIKLAKLSVAAACRLFSTEETGEMVIVTHNHVMLIVNYLNEIYSKPSFDYKGYSDLEIQDEKAGLENIGDVMDLLYRFDGLAECCIRLERFFTRVFEEQLATDRFGALEITRKLVALRMLKISNGNQYVKTSGFINILRIWEKQNKTSEVIN